MSIFRSIISDDVVEDAVVHHLRRWLPTYLSEVERQRGLAAGYYERPPESSYTVRAEFDSFPEEMLPLVVVVAPGITDDPPKDGGGSYRPGFQIGVTCVVSTSDGQVGTRRAAYRLGAAIRAVLLQKQSLMPTPGGELDNLVRGVGWIGTRNNELPPDAERTIWACRQLFEIEIDGALTTKAGPANPVPDPTLPPVEPPADPNVPFPDWDQVETATVTHTSTKEPANT